MNLTGTIGSLPDARGNVTVQMGILRSQVNISDLEIIEEVSPYAPKRMNRTAKSKIKMSKSLSVSPEINLLGKTVDEAVAELDKYLDDALLSASKQRTRSSRKRNRSFQKRNPRISAEDKNMSNHTALPSSEKAMPESQSLSSDNGFTHKTEEKYDRKTKNTNR